MNLLSAFGGGLWIIPVGLFLAAIYSASRAIRSMKSGSTIQNRDGSTTQSDKNVGWFQTGGGWFAIGFGLAAVIATLVMIGER